MKLWKWLLASLAISSLVACGGSVSSSDANGGGGGDGGAGTAGGTIELSLSSTTVTAGAPAIVSALVRDATGAGVAGQVVSFSTPGGLGAFSVNTALTDATGAASVSLTPATDARSGADQVVANASLNGEALEASKGFQLTATSVSIASFAADVETLSAYGQTTLLVQLADAPAGVPVGVSVTTACAAKEKATLTPASTQTATGSATFTYRDQGCGATERADAIQVTVDGTAAVASLSLPLTSPDVGSITFVSASRPKIYLKGSGLDETSEVTFQIRDTAGNGLPGQVVTLDATTFAGGLTIDGGSTRVTKTSDSNGNVIVRINSGTVPTPVRVRAQMEVDGVSVATVSSNLSIGVGLPSQLNFSLSQGTKNIEGYNIDGTPNTYNIIASDRLSNPVPDGTAINFIAEGGQVESSRFTATTSAGLSSAVANFVSSAPRPDDGRVTVLAYALGEESFLDEDGNNVFDGNERFQDLGNVFLDRLFDGRYDAATDQFISLSISGTASCVEPDSSSLIWRNPITMPSIGANTCDGMWGRAYVRMATETVLSTSAARPVWARKPTNLHGCAGQPVDLQTTPDPNNKTSFRPLGDGGLYGVSVAGVLSFYVSDANSFRLNPMAAGTTISVTATTGMAAKVEGGSPVASTLEATFAAVSYEFTNATSGTVFLNFRSPGGLITTVPVSISTQAAPGGSSVCP